MKQGDIITLFGAGPSLNSQGSLSSIMLQEEGYTGQALEIQKIIGDEGVVILPSGKSLRIQERDIASKITDPKA